MFSLLSEQNDGIGSGLYYIFCYGLPRYILINFDQVKIKCSGEEPSTNQILPPLRQVPLRLNKF